MILDMKNFRYLVAVCFILMPLLSLSAQSLVNKTWDFQYGDTAFSEPYIDVDEWRDFPVRHHYIHGGFKSNGTRFSFYFPSKEAYDGRFFQYITPMPDNEYIVQNLPMNEYNSIAFSIENGAYFIETNEGGAVDLSNPMAEDPTIGAYRANAASAMFSRLVAKELYSCDRPYGYCFGGSGGAYRTVGSIESTQGVWDGAVPYVIGSPYAIPNVFAVRMHAMRVLDKKLPQIIDAIEPGGSGNPYAGLNEEETQVLREATAMGFPLKSWYGYKEMGIHGFVVLYPTVVMMDSSYFNEDFWNKPGYYGHDHPESFEGYRIRQSTSIKRFVYTDEAVRIGLIAPVSEADRGSADKSWAAAGGSSDKPVAVELTAPLPEVQFLGGDLVALSGDAAGESLQLSAINATMAAFGPTVSDASLAKLKVGDEVRVDNSNFLAVQTLYRHQVPDVDLAGWQMFKDANGEPVYPQRPMLLGPVFTQGAAGILPSGNIHGKVILCCSLMDREAFAWQGDWYRRQVAKSLGPWTDQNLRLWYTDNALHGDQEDQLDDKTHAVPYNGVLQQALLDLSRWVEKGIEPALSTDYRIENAQVIVPETANERRGIQPVVNISILDDDKSGLVTHNGKRIDTRRGATVEFKVVAEVPAGQGKVMLAQISYDGKDYSEEIDLSQAVYSADGCKVEFTIRHQFNDKGTHFPTVRVASQREVNPSSPFTRIYNLDRVRVVVK